MSYYKRNKENTKLIFIFTLVQAANEAAAPFNCAQILFISPRSRYFETSIKYGYHGNHTNKAIGRKGRLNQKTEEWQ